MTDLPYTDADLRAEAARQHKTLTEDPDFMGISERMQDQEITPDGGVAWGDFSDATVDAAQRTIHDLITNAADVSEWAINLGVAGLRPGPSYAIVCRGQHDVAVQIATTDLLTDAAREALMPAIRQAVDEAVARVLKCTLVREH